MMTGWLVGVVALGWVRDNRLALAREAEQRAASEERLRIARELHDVVGHHISLINVQSAAALQPAPQGPRGRPAAGGGGARRGQGRQPGGPARAAGGPGGAAAGRRVGAHRARGRPRPARRSGGGGPADRPRRRGARRRRGASAARPRWTSPRTASCRSR
ncbi:histidine kinase [Streptomyces sp. UP1A-1]|nr:histidine kinase [Streptomyces sp. UP1A-1]